MNLPLFLAAKLSGPSLAGTIALFSIFAPFLVALANGEQEPVNQVPGAEALEAARQLRLPDSSPGALLQMATKTVTYKTVNGVPLEIHIFIPQGLEPNERRPAILFIHGGGWTVGDPSLHALECLYFSRLGMVAASVSYRLLPTSGKPGQPPPKQGPRSIARSPADCLTDAKSAMRYFRAHAADFHVDPDKIVAAGGSAGAHLASALATIEGYDDVNDDQAVSTKPSALMLIVPAFDLVSGWRGGQIQAQKAGLDPKAFSPALLAGKDFPPTIILAGKEDGLSPEASNKSFIEKIKAAGGDAELVEFTGQGHRLYMRSGKDAHFQAVLYFMDQFLTRLGFLPAHAAPPVPVVKYEVTSSRS